VPTGFDELDEMLSGLQRGEMIILAARPSMGKTAFALNMAENMAAASNGVAFFSLEMGKQQLVQRILCAKGGVDGQKLRKNMLSREEWRRIMGACEGLKNSPIFIDDTPGLTLLQMRSKARRMKEKHGIGAVVIDYLQLMSSGTRVESRQVEVSEISRGVKAMARELDVPVVCLSQLNRQAEGREGHRPRMSDLRESGSIEQDADVVMMLHREAYYHKSDANWVEANPLKANVAEVIVAKQRNGPTGTVELLWDSSSTAFRNLVQHGSARGVEYAGRSDGGADYGDLPG
jgi:replicative DNA helicase